jgi:hypothetical protein
VDTIGDGDFFCGVDCEMGGVAEVADGTGNVGLKPDVEMDGSDVALHNGCGISHIAGRGGGEREGDYTAMKGQAVTNLGINEGFRMNNKALGGKVAEE